MSKKQSILENQSSQIVIYQNADGDIKLDVFLENETVWLNQEQLALLFGKARSTINEHIGNIFNEKELDKSLCMKKFGNSEFQQKAPLYYNLDVIISVGYRVKSPQGTKFRIWATKRLREYIVKGFALNDDRFKTAKSMNYFDELQSRIREIRLSERFFYQKIKDIYTTSIDYDAKEVKTINFFKIIQNKLIWAISKQTAAELVHNRVDAELPLMGMKSVGKKNKSVNKNDLSISKNYLTVKEIKLLGLIVEQYLSFAENMVSQKVTMSMNDWINQLDIILKMNKRELLGHAGKISRKEMEKKVNLEYKKYTKKQIRKEKALSLTELEEDLKNLEE
jgi:hypothetical protein